jgi:pimeloyl-ACP methyl ester carboxylesterase
VQLLKDGSGPPVVVFHHDIGNQGWLPYYMELAENHTVYVPSHPGFGKSERPEWARNVRDIACVYQRLLKDLGLNSTAAVGLGFGGWILAEMATMCHHEFSHLVLVNAMGIQPTRGEITDQHAGLRAGGFRRPGAIRRAVQGAPRRRSVGDLGGQPRDDHPDRVEAVYV